MDFIESKLAQRHVASPAEPPPPPPPPQQQQQYPTVPPTPILPPAPQKPPQQQPQSPVAIPAPTELNPPAVRGKLIEVDLGEEARSRNVQLTERARRRIDGDDEAEDEGSGTRRPRKVRLGRDGKPRVWRQRNRRNSDDVKRDKIVEELLHENRRMLARTVPNGMCANFWK